MGPVQPDYSDAEPGFSIIKRESGESGAQITMLEGFKQTPTVDNLLSISNDLLEGKIEPTATSAQPSVSMATP